MAMTEYNGIVMLQVNGLSGRMEADEVKECVKELPQTYLAFIGSSGKSVKIWVRFTYPDNRLPDNREQAEVFHAHAYRLSLVLFSFFLSLFVLLACVGQYIFCTKVL
jgi:hypothetical protein